MEEREETKIISLSIPIGMYDWLEEHKEINRSELFRDAVRRVQEFKKAKISPLLFLVSVMGVVFSIALIGIGLAPSPMNLYARALLTLLGGFLAIITAVVYYKARKEIAERAVTNA